VREDLVELGNAVVRHSGENPPQRHRGTEEDKLFWSVMLRPQAEAP
jgi:hypothetical protein